ncbi:MAG: hypothetical protein DI623_11345 [Sphingomonas sanxanigenens]|uniref:Uncharacterized protein n=1 Tax=Sphingomonas sanxanigenens TaxID=397260 RepID=A0A2W5A6P3_9SPHN|nr:MAG: hypothetical protein DI623_11345 [Sphingomonas sanxanigenens]
MTNALRIWSKRAPFRRAGLAWGDVNEPCVVDIAVLDGARFHALIQEPVLRIEAEQDGTFIALPAAFADLSAEDLDRLIGMARASMPLPPASPEQAEIERLAAGWDDARKAAAVAIEERDAAREEADTLRGELATLREKHAELERAAAATPETPPPPADADDQATSSTAPPASDAPARRKTSKAG